VTVNSARYERAVLGFGNVVAQGTAESWSAPSPCSEWTARHIVGHVIAVQHAIAATIEGVRPPMNPMKEPDRFAGDDPAATWLDAAATVRAAIAGADITNHVVTMWRGEMTVDEMLGYNIGDTTVHTWDLARALGVDDSLDADLVGAALELYEPIADTMRAPNVFADLVEVDTGADPQTRLLALVGRRRVV
jgi:uncharacterized protein (TIGR03086 family)